MNLTMKYNGNEKTVNLLDEVLSHINLDKSKVDREMELVEEMVETLESNLQHIQNGFGEGKDGKEKESIDKIKFNKMYLVWLEKIKESGYELDLEDIEDEDIFKHIMRLTFDYTGKKSIFIKPMVNLDYELLPPDCPARNLFMSAYSSVSDVNNLELEIIKHFSKEEYNNSEYLLKRLFLVKWINGCDVNIRETLETILDTDTNYREVMPNTELEFLKEHKKRIHRNVLKFLLKQLGVSDFIFDGNEVFVRPSELRENNKDIPVYMNVVCSLPTHDFIIRVNYSIFNLQSTDRGII